MQAVTPAIQPPASSSEMDVALATLVPLAETDCTEAADEETYNIEAGFLNLLSSFEIKQPPVVEPEAETRLLDAKNDNRNDAKSTEGAMRARDNVDSNILPLPLKDTVKANATAVQTAEQHTMLSENSTAQNASIAIHDHLHAQQTSDHSADQAKLASPKVDTIHNATQDLPPTISLQHVSDGGATTTIHAPALPSSISPALMLNQVVSHLRENLTQGTPQQTLTLTLIPAELGHITINASFEGPSLSLAFQGMPATLDLLKTHQGLLLQNLSTQGIIVHQSDLSFHQNTDGGRDEQSPDSAQDPPPISFKKLRESLHRLKQGLFA